MTMLTELETLQKLVKQLNDGYKKDKKELIELKKRPMVDASEVLSARQQNTRLENNFKDLQGKYDDLAHEMEKLKKQLAEQETANKNLNKEVEELQQDKKELLAKNEISSQRAQTILERLSALDNTAEAAQ